jgi:hypothetical protein
VDDVGMTDDLEKVADVEMKIEVELVTVVGKRVQTSKVEQVVVGIHKRSSMAGWDRPKSLMTRRIV